MPEVAHRNLMSDRGHGQTGGATALTRASSCTRMTSLGHTHTENNTPDTGTHTYTTKATAQTPNEHPPQTLHKARRWRVCVERSTGHTHTPTVNSTSDTDTHDKHNSPTPQTSTRHKHVTTLDGDGEFRIPRGGFRSSHPPRPKLDVIYINICLSDEILDAHLRDGQTQK